MNTGGRWTDEERDACIGYRKQEMSYDNIARQPDVNHSASAIIRMFDRIAAPEELRAPVHEPLSAEDRREILHLRHEGFSYQQIADRVKRGYNSVRNVCTGDTGEFEDEFGEPTHPLEFTDEQLARVGVFRKGETR